MYVVGKYELTNKLGDGAFGEVLGTHIDTGARVSVKMMDLHQVRDMGRSRNVLRKISMLMKLDHAGIVHLIEVLKSDHHIFLVCAEGGDLFDKLVQQEVFNEQTARTYFAKIADAVDYCHQQGVCHRDLKPENLFLSADGRLLISDFGFSRAFIDHDTLMDVYTRCGTPNYCAPEVFTCRSYDARAADVWSMGVVLYVMVAGYLPFDERSLSTLYHKICTADYKCPRHMPRAARQLIERIIVVDPAARITLAEIKAHPWMASTKYSSHEFSIDKGVDLRRTHIGKD
ncbi:kinase-like domain-containing protein [Tribonema minus]|uniref:non-specific serine/threonine protein kinase n=1 Tax=Tribonema minus TaxID=303371 RepID=A0A835ZM85_9STRA|nr:kinase-like domain-containing protein [Tribonema minus]